MDFKKKELKEQSILGGATYPYNIGDFLTFTIYEEQIGHITNMIKKPYGIQLELSLNDNTKFKLDRNDYHAIINYKLKDSILSEYNVNDYLVIFDKKTQTKYAQGYLREYSSINSNLYILEDNDQKYGLPNDFLKLYDPLKKYEIIVIPLSCNASCNIKKDDILKKKNILDTVCIREGYRQHEGECWNDSIHQFICFADKLSYDIQSKLLTLTANEILYLAKSSKRTDLIPDELFTPENEENIIKYLELLIERFKLYKTRNKVSVPNLDNTSAFDFDVIPKGNKLLRRSPSYRCAIDSADIGLKIANPKIKVSKKGGTYYDSNKLLFILSCVLLDGNNYLIPKEVFIPRKQFDKTFKINYQYTDEDIDNAVAISLSIQYASDAFHATCFYTCKGNNIYYDDNKSMNRSGSEEGVLDFDWKTYMKKLKLNNLFPVIGFKGFHPSDSNSKFPCYYDHVNDLFIDINGKTIIDVVGIITNFTFYFKNDDKIKVMKNRNELMFFDSIITHNDINILKKYRPFIDDINMIHSGYSALHYAVFKENIEIIKFLIDNGANVNLINTNGYSPLSLSRNEEIKKLLISNGAIEKVPVNNDVEYLDFNLITQEDRILKNERLSNYFNYAFYFCNIAFHDGFYKNIPFELQKEILRNVMKRIKENHSTDEILIKYLKQVHTRYPKIGNEALVHNFDKITLDNFDKKKTIMQYVITLRWGVNLNSKHKIIVELITMGANINQINDKFIQVDERFTSPKFSLKELTEYAKKFGGKKDDFLQLFILLSTYDYLFKLEESNAADMKAKSSESPAQVNPSGSAAKTYYHKYLKYKNKYIELKKL